MTSEKIRSIVERMRGVIRILDSATPKDRRRVYEAAQLTVLYDHETAGQNQNRPRSSGRGVEF